MKMPLSTCLGATLLALTAAAQAAPPAPRNVDPLRLQYERGGGALSWPARPDE